MEASSIIVSSDVNVTNSELNNEDSCNETVNNRSMNKSNINHTNLFNTILSQLLSLLDIHTRYVYIEFSNSNSRISQTGIKNIITCYTKVIKELDTILIEIYSQAKPDKKSKSAITSIPSNGVHYENIGEIAYQLERLSLAHNNIEDFLIHECSSIDKFIALITNLRSSIIGNIYLCKYKNHKPDMPKLKEMISIVQFIINQKKSSI